MKRPKKGFGLKKLLSRFLPKKPGRPQHDISEIQQTIGHRFKNRDLLVRALTHKSSVSVDDPKGLNSNERLEFLGDSVVNCLVTEHLFHIYPDKSEGQLSKIKSLIVSRKILGEIGHSMNLGKHLVLGSSERDSGGTHKNSIVSNAFEAVVGALYLDAGLGSCRTFLQRHLFPGIDSFLKEKSNVNYKSKILELSQRDGFGIPRYSVVSSWGPEHAKMFRIKIEIAGVPMGEGTGSNKKIAQQSAAKEATKNYDSHKILALHKGAKKDDELVSD